MSSSDQEVQNERGKRTLWLLVAAALSLLVPLVGVFFIRRNENTGTRAPNAAVIFDRREASEQKVNTTPMPAPAPRRARPPETAGSSLDFVKAGKDYVEKPPASAPPPRAQAKKPIDKVEKPAARTPKLKGVKSFSTFKPSSSKTRNDGQAPNDLLKSLPPEARNNPELQQYLESREK
ncbi:MAG: hypothetical protein AAB036_12275 [Elusimicrobiota bacterium]